MHTTRRTRISALTSWIVLFASLTLVVPAGARALAPTAAESPAGGSSAPHAWLPLIVNYFPPPATISRYMSLASLYGFTPGYNLGRSRAQTTLPGQNIVIILDFLYPYTAGDGWEPEDGVFLREDRSVFESEEDVGETVYGFINGFMAGG